MKSKIYIKNNFGETIYSGSFLDIPIKESAISSKCKELFLDDDPCIIHRSYANKAIIFELIHLLFKDDTSIHEIVLNEYSNDKIDVINLPDICSCKIIC